jgi:hypothetical protein
MALPDDRAAAPFRFPPLVESKASLRPLEKSLLGHFILLAQPKMILEIGVYRAVTTQFIIELLELNDIDCKVVGFDLPEVVEQLRREHADVPRWEASGRLELVGGQLPASLHDWLQAKRPEVGLALIDARHEYGSVIWELRLIWPWLARHGYIIGHDYSAEFDGVRYAFDHFARKQGAMLMPLQAAGDDPAERSVIVALRQPTYRKTAGAWLHHHWEGWKADVVRSRFAGALWRKVLRPIFRGRR